MVGKMWRNQAGSDPSRSSRCRPGDLGPAPVPDMPVNLQRAAHGALTTGRSVVTADLAVVAGLDDLAIDLQRLVHQPGVTDVAERHEVLVVEPSQFDTVEQPGILVGQGHASLIAQGLGQPWQVHVISGATRDALSLALHAANREGRPSPDFSWDEGTFSGRYLERHREHGKRRDEAAAVNFSFFHAPHVALLFIPVFGDGVRVAGDLGMYGQTFLLALAARGLGGVPQTVLGL